MMSFMDYPIVNDIISNIWWFQTESVVPLFQELSIMILILFIADFVIGITFKVLMKKTILKQSDIPGLIVYPILIAILYSLLYFFGGFFDFNFASITISEIFDNAIKYWWVFFIFWPVVLVALPFRLIFKAMGRGSEHAGKFMEHIPIGTFEEFAFRYLAINTIFLLTNSIEIALLFSTIAFSLIHLPNMGEGWNGPFVICSTLISGLIYGIIAIKYGLVFSILAHVLYNMQSVSPIMGSIKEKLLG
jgi:hypothetical protein